MIDIRKSINLHYIFATIIIGLIVLGSILRINPDSDSYFLVETGRYIVENLKLPDKNIWTIHDNFDMMVQQWLSCVFNFSLYSILGEKGLALLAIIYTTIFNIALYNYAKMYCKGYKLLIVIWVVNISMSGFMTSRPSILTMSLLLLELIALNKFYYSEYKKEKAIKLLFILSIISILQINLHSSLWFFDIIFMFPYIVPSIFNIKKFEINKIKTMLIGIIVMFLVGLLNPNGIYAYTYLIKSYGEISSELIISELLSPHINSRFGAVIVLVVVLFTVYISKTKLKDLDNVTLYMTLGAFILSFKHIRNNWMLTFSLVQLLSFYLNNYTNINDIKPDKIPKLTYKFIKTAYLIVSITLFIFTIYLAELDTKDVATFGHKPDEAIEYLDNLDKNDIKLYNDFATGNYLELKGYKVYIDARPELYTPVINGTNIDVYDEYIKVNKGSINFNEFTDKYKFTHLIVNLNSKIDIYLHYNDDYELVIDEENYRMYEFKHWEK